MESALTAPYILLFLAVLAARFYRSAGFVIWVGAVLVAFTMDALEPVACLALTLAAFFAAVNRSRVGFSFLLLTAVALENYLFPGFHNPRVIDGVRFGADSLPFTMYLNFDKVSAGLLIYIFAIKPRAPDLKVAGLATLGLIALLMPIALAIHFVRFDPKFPPQTWIWALNNLFFVALSEEALFRGLIQGRLEEKFGRWVAIVVASLLFAAAHYKGGLNYVALAGVAGLFYGYVYSRTKSLDSAIITHFGLNLAHFLFFSYPALGK